MLIRELNDEIIIGTHGLSEQPMRVAARTVLIKDGRIAFVHVHTYEHITLPGGGVEIGETPKEAAVRETREETGYDCVITGELGYIDENRCSGDYVQRSYYFTAEPIGERKELKLTEKEQRLGVTLEWYSLADALDVVSSAAHDVMQRLYIQRRDVAVLTRLALFSPYKSPLGTAVSLMIERLSEILGNDVTIYIHGSVTMGDFRLGWSDIDILVLTASPLTASQADKLVLLRQSMVEETGEPLFRAFEGGILPRDAFLSGQGARTVYWGTSGQRITEDYTFDVFSRLALIDDGILLQGEAVSIQRPSRETLNCAIRQQLDAIRKYSGETGDSVYSAGWLFDIARCLYTLETGKISSKTRALEWALKHKLCPEPSIARRALKIRRAPNECKSPETRKWLKNLAPEVIKFCSVLQNKLDELSGV